MFNLSEEMQSRILKNFKKVIDKGNSELISKDLYYHLNLNCNFIANFNLQGFREAYSGERFQEFLDQFNRNSPASQWLYAPEISEKYEVLNQTMADLVSQKLEQNKTQIIL
ncbi:hypothetical protein [Desulfitobacterium sp.]|uniref:hypothetical protein n=1 Tax=Desulfitobacterium sp. TaxID=49981 RepID=UPI002B211B3C|nr:hypothetical protein [Desulfitobacterium sp.]MEA4902083.1 hypothetical protein [Desulfitobacterium sp.]